MKYKFVMILFLIIAINIESNAKLLFNREYRYFNKNYKDYDPSKDFLGIYLCSSLKVNWKKDDFEESEFSDVKNIEQLLQNEVKRLFIKKIEDETLFLKKEIVKINNLEDLQNKVIFKKKLPDVKFISPNEKIKFENERHPSIILIIDSWRISEKWIPSGSNGRMERGAELTIMYSLWNLTNNELIIAGISKETDDMDKIQLYDLNVLTKRSVGDIFKRSPFK